MGGSERCPAVRHPRSAAHLRTEVSQLRDDWHLRYVRAHVTCTRKERNLLVLAILPVLRCAGPASRGIPRFSPTEGMGNGSRPIPYAVRCVRHSTAGYLTPTPKKRIYIAPHVQQNPVGLDAKCEERLTRSLGVRSALEAGGGRPPFSTAMAATPERTDRTLENDHLYTGPTGQGGATRSAAERRHTAGRTGASRCAYCGRALEEPTWDSAVYSLWALNPCPHGEQVHARCMLDRAERLASGHADPQQCVACRSEWPARNPPLHPAELAEDLPRPRPGGRWSPVAGALQLTELLEEDGPRLDPATDVTTGSHDTVEEMVRTHRSRPACSFLLCALFSDALGLPQGAYLRLPPTEGMTSGSRSLP